MYLSTTEVSVGLNFHAAPKSKSEDNNPHKKFAFLKEDAMDV